MNIYFDTNVLYSDPFFKSSFSELLIKSASDNATVLCIPSICLNELYFKLSDKAKLLENEAKNKFGELNKWTNNTLDFPDVNIERFENLLREFYESNILQGVFQKIDFKQEFFVENLEKAIKGMPPFFADKKEEFRDSLIWSTIRDHSKITSGKKGYFLTANYGDFWNKERNDFHSNLKKESGNLIIIDSVKKLFEIETDLIDYQKRGEFKNWLDKQNISEAEINWALDKYLWTYIIDLIDKAIKIYPVKNVKAEYEMGYIIPYFNRENFIISRIISNEPVEDFAIFVIEAKLFFEGKLFFANFEKKDFSNFETLSFKSNITLNLTYDKDELFKPLNLKIESLEVE